MTLPVQSFEFVLGSPGGATFGLSLKEDQWVYLSVPLSNNLLDQPPQAQERVIAFDFAAWEKFLHRIQAIGVSNWMEHYDSEAGFDRSFWKLKMITDTLSIHSGGSGAYPGGQEGLGYSPQFKDFVLAVRELSGVEDFGSF